MKVIVLFALLLIVSCNENESLKDDLTGNEVVFSLTSGSVYEITGTVTFKEKKDLSTMVIVELSGTEGEIQHPVHLHLGDVSTPAAEIAGLLNPVKGNLGRSETSISRMADETLVTYKQLIDLNACIKIHLSDNGPDRDIILAAGNIGSAASTRTNGRLEIGVCKSQ